MYILIGKLYPEEGMPGTQIPDIGILADDDRSGPVTM
jgi:hypothetical protein